MNLAHPYGETPLEGDEFDALRREVRELLGAPLTKAAVYDLEQGIQEQATERLLTEVLNGSLTLEMLLSDFFIRDLHRQLYADIWAWGGTLRKRELNIGVAPEQIAVALRDCVDSARYRWYETDYWTPRVLGIAVHAETVRIHPFADGNGRTTRLLADLVHVAAQSADAVEAYDWEVDKPTYIGLLKEYDVHRNPEPLAAFIEVRLAT